MFGLKYLNHIYFLNFKYTQILFAFPKILKCNRFYLENVFITSLLKQSITEINLGKYKGNFKRNEIKVR